LVDKGYLQWATDEEELFALIDENIDKKVKNNIKRNIDIEQLVQDILND
jgi:hypothetical protein